MFSGAFFVLVVANVVLQMNVLDVVHAETVVVFVLALLNVCAYSSLHFQ